MKKVLAANRILVCLLSAILVLSALSAVAFASSGQVTVTVAVTSGDKTYHYGDEITLTYTIHNSTSTGIGSCSFNVNYDNILDQDTISAQPLKGSFSAFDYPLCTIGGVDPAVTDSEWSALIVTGKIASRDKHISVGTRSITATMTAAGSATGDNISFDGSAVTTNIKLEHQVEEDHQWSEEPSSWKEGHKADCTHGGTPIYDCTIPGCDATKEGEYIPAGGHNWSYDWNLDQLNKNTLGGNHEVTVSRTCQNDGCPYYTEAEQGTVTVKQGATKNPTCLQTGTVTWDITATFDAEEPSSVTYTKDNTGTLDAKGHDWADAQFVWDHENWGGDPDEPPTVTVTRVCNNDPRNEHPEEHVMETPVTVTEVHDSRRDSTCQVTGTVKYTATAKFLKSLPKEFDDGVTSTEEEFVIPLKKHAYTEEVKWGSWTEDSPPTITATRKCDVGGEDVTGEITYSESKSEQSCTKPVTTTYTAYATFTDDTVTQHECSQKKEVRDQITGHSYGDPVFHWEESAKPEGPDYKYTGKVTATLTCANTHTDETTDGPQSIDVTVKVGTDGSYKEGTEPNCVNGGTLTYEGTVDYKDRADGKGTEQDHWADHTEEPKPDTIDFTYDPLGHQWPEEPPELTWANETDPNSVTATAKMKCQRSGCDDATGYGAEGGKEVAASIAKDVTAATCTENGAAKYTATLAITDAQPAWSQTYDVKEVTLTAQGHKLGTVTYNWPSAADELAKGDSGLTDGDVTATAVCSVCGKQLSSTSVKLEKGTGEQWKAPTYLANGVHTYTASDAEFSDGLTGTLKATTSDTKDYTLTKLDPPVPVEPTVPTGNVTDEQGVKNALSAAASAAVTQALNSPTCPTGMEKELYDAIREAGAGTGGMSVSTELTVDDKNQTPVDGKTYTPGAGQTLENYYDIQIKVTVISASISGGSQTSKITQIATPIQLSVAAPGSGGPIFYVARYHDGSWQKLPTTVSGNYLLFSSNLFSPYAVISSNSIADAEVDPIPNQTYTGSAITPKVVVYINGDKEHPLVEGVDYELEWSNNVNVGTATVTIKSLGTHGLDAASTKTVTFSIVAAPSGGSGSGGATSPNTGDEAPLALYAGMLTLCLAGLAGIAVRRRKNK